MASDISTGTFIDPDIDGPVSCIDVDTLRQELESLLGPRVCPELLDFTDALLVVDPTNRPSAAEALQHAHLRFAEA